MIPQSLEQMRWIAKASGRSYLHTRRSDDTGEEDKTTQQPTQRAKRLREEEMCTNRVGPRSLALASREFVVAYFFPLT